MEGSKERLGACATQSQPTIENEYFLGSLESLNIKPQNDPDSPPFMFLVEASTIDNSEADTTNFFCQNDNQNTSEALPSTNLRIRTHSADWQYSILGFLNRKIRQRVMSQELRAHQYF